MKAKVLIVESGDHQFEILPSWIHTFEECGFDVYLYCSRNAKNRGILKIIGDNTKCTVVLKVETEKYDIVINNTYYQHLQNRVPYLGTVGLGGDLEVGSICHEMEPFKDKRVNDPNHTVITLAKHMDNRMKNFAKNTTYMYPVFFGNKVSQKVLGKKRTFVVQGAFAGKRRNYQGLIKLVKDFQHRDDFTIILMGSGGNLLGKVKSALKGYVASGKVKFLHNLNYTQYFQILQNVNFILPLLDKNSSVSSDYFYNKISSSIMMGVGHAIPLLCDNEIVKLYDFENNKNCFGYSDYEEFKKVFVKALELNQNKYDEMTKNVQEKRAEWLRISKENMISTFG